jgi:CheY-like chemotaxis protein
MLIYGEAMARILIVDDNQDAADTLTALLELDGHVVAAVYSGAAAVQRAQSFLPDVVICDLAMPQMDGYETCEALRRLPEIGATRFVVISGYGQEQFRHRSDAEGFCAHLVKPVDVPQLRALLQRLEAP